MPLPANDLFSYVDYRMFLRDWLSSAKGRKSFSFRQFATRAGLGSPGYLKMVIDGQRNLGADGLERFMNGMRLTGADRLFFRNLVLWNQAATGDEKGLYEGKLALLRKCRREAPHVIPAIKEKIERVRGEILTLLAADLTPEEALSLASQLLPEE